MVATYRIENFEVIHCLEGLQPFHEFGQNMQFVGVFVVFRESPELLEAVQLFVFAVLKGNRH